MGSSDKFCLRWNDFQMNVSTTFQELRTESSFSDVTLACRVNDFSIGNSESNSRRSQRTIKAHRFVLSSCSTFFKDIFMSMNSGSACSSAQPLIYLSGIDYHDLESVLDFMYFGKVNIDQSRLSSFLAAAEELKVKGLVQGKSETETPKRTPNKSSSNLGSKKMKFSGKRKLAEDHHPPQPEILRDDFGAESSSSFQEFLGDDRSMADVGNDDDFVDPFNDDVTGASEEGGGGSEASKGEIILPP